MRCIAKNYPAIIVSRYAQEISRIFPECAIYSVREVVVAQLQSHEQGIAGLVFIAGDKTGRTTMASTIVECCERGPVIWSGVCDVEVVYAHRLAINT